MFYWLYIVLWLDFFTEEMLKPPLLREFENHLVILIYRIPMSHIWSLFEYEGDTY